MNDDRLRPGLVGRPDTFLVGPDALALDASRESELLIGRMHIQAASGHKVTWCDERISLPAVPQLGHETAIVIGFEQVDPWGVFEDASSFPLSPRFRPTLLDPHEQHPTNGGLLVGFLARSEAGAVEFRPTAVWGDRLDSHPILEAWGREVRRRLACHEALIDRLTLDFFQTGNSPHGVVHLLAKVVWRLEAALNTTTGRGMAPWIILDAVASYLHAFSDLPERSRRIREPTLRTWLDRAPFLLTDHGAIDDVQVSCNLSRTLAGVDDLLDRTEETIWRLIQTLAVEPEGHLPATIYREGEIYERIGERVSWAKSASGDRAIHEVSIPQIDKAVVFLGLLWERTDIRFGDVLISDHRPGSDDARGEQVVLGRSKVGYHWIKVASGAKVYLTARTRLELIDGGAYTALS